ncbi:MAG: SpoIIE family protein phosphatase [Acidobacteriota bacterium]|nr:SpoIIE family protein phosphatase [Acidobacteriota bacterium]
MSAKSAAAEKEARKDFVTAFADAVQRFTSPATNDEVLALVPNMLVHDFAAERSELWLWDEQSGSAYLTHSATQAGGKDVSHRHDYAAKSEGVIGKVAAVSKTIENIKLASFGGDDQEFAERTGFSHVSAYPLAARGRLGGVIVNYATGPVSEEILKWWLLYAEITSVSVQQALAAQESQKTITQLSLLFEATRLLNSTLDLAELLDLILKIARTEVKADRGTVFLVDPQKKELWSIVASGLQNQEIRLPFGKGVAGRVGETGEAVNIDDAYNLPYFDRSFDTKTGYRTKSLLCLPIRHHTGEIVGVIQLLNAVNGKFKPEDLDFLQKLSGHMAMALENARLHRESLEKQRLQREMDLARSIQRSLLPEAPPVVPGYEIAVLNEPCFECGGDYYDFLNLGPQTLLLVVADVEGKGVASALVMSNLQATLRALVMHLHSLEVLTLSLNEMIYNDTKSEKYLSIFLGLVDTRRNGLHYINAGHVPPILVSGATGEWKQLTDGGTVIGLFPHAEYQRGSVKLNPGDVLVTCTDGIGEAQDTKEEEYGSERLADCIARNRDKSAQEIVDIVLREVTDWSRGGTHVDDKVLMILKVNDQGSITQAIARGEPRHP